jgi:hypothetical protein
MPSFIKGGTAKTPFGVNEFLRSTVGIKTTPYTVAASSVPAQTIDGVPNQKILQRGTVMAKITSGPEAGTAEVQALTPSGTWSGGTYTLSFNGYTTGNIAYNANAAAITAALTALTSVGGAGGVITATGGPMSSGAVTLTFGGSLSGDQPQVTINTTNVTGSSPAAVASTTTPGVAGSLDGRATTSNIVGICDTFLPWQLTEHDDQVSVVYDAAVVQGWCIELNAAGAQIACQNATATAMVAQKGINILFS